MSDAFGHYGETEHGYYVQVGDKQEWHWKFGHEPPEKKPKKPAEKNTEKKAEK
jgi:hypothetical protein